MKKVYLMFCAIGMVGMVACGGSHTEEKAAATPNADSMAAAANQNMEAAPAADSTAAPAHADSAAAEHSEHH